MALAESRTRDASSAASQPAWLQNLNPVAILVAVVILVMPAIAGSFVLTQIFAWSFLLGTIALSQMFLAGYGGMVSLAQMTVAGFAGYVVAIFGANGVPGGLGWPWWLAVPMALILAMIFGAIIGALAVRTEGIYTIMITLAIAAAFFYFTNENYAIFNGHTGIDGIPTPVFLGVDWHAAIPFYYLTLVVAILCWQAVSYVSPAPLAGPDCQGDVDQGGKGAEEACHAAQFERVGRADGGQPLSDAIHDRRPASARRRDRPAGDCAIASRGQ